MRSKLLSAAALVVFISACSTTATNQTVPKANAGSTIDNVTPDVDGTSILKTLTTQTIIGSTVDPSNGDQTPSGITYISQPPYGGGKIKKGDLVVCNYADKNGMMGNGTTEEVLVAKTGAKPAHLVQSTKIQGCTAVGIERVYDYLYSSDSTAKNAAAVSPKGSVYQTITGSSITQPYGGTFVDVLVTYPPGPGYWVGDATSGSINRIDLGTLEKKPPVTAVITGFKVNKGKPGSVLGPTAMAFQKMGADGTLYVADGASNILYSFAHAYNDFFQTGSIKIGPTGKTFTGPEAKNAKVLLSGSALSGPISMTILPNGNMVVANSKNNELVEIESTGKVLATKIVDKGAAGAIRGITAVGTSDTNTVLYFTDDNANNVQVLSK